MFNIIDNSGCTINLYFLNDAAFVCGDVRTFNKQSYKDSMSRWLVTLDALKNEGQTKVFCQLKKTQLNMLRFVKRLGFVEQGSNDQDVLLVREL
jgi:hypothetical protein